MDFFEAQARARRRTGRLVLLFALAVLGTVVALYFAFILGTAWLGLHITDSGGGLERGPTLEDPIVWWQPGAFKAVAAFVAVTIGLASLWKWFELRAGGPAVAESVGGVRLDSTPTDAAERRLLNIVEEMSIASGLPVPAIYVLPDEAGLNAFAAGYSQNDAAVAVTRGALDRLARDELQGVIAHEFSHILNGDMRLNTRLLALLYGILSLMLLGRGLIRAAFELSRGSGDSKKNGLAIGVPLAVGGGALMLIGGGGHFFGRLIQAAVSRQREHLADAAAVQFTRNPAGLAGALKKVGGLAVRGNLVAPSTSQISHFCFAQCFRADLAGLFATHPPLEERVRALDPAFDGNFPSSPALPPPLRPAARTTRPAFSVTPPPLPGRGIEAALLIASAGELNRAGVAAGRALLDGLPELLRQAAHDPARVSALCYAICLPVGLDPATVAARRAVIARHAAFSDSDQTAALLAALETLPSGHRLPLLQIASPALRQLDPPARDRLLETLDELVHADGVVTPHEFALQKIVARTLGLAAAPRDALQALAPSRIAPDLAVALSAAARIDHPEPADAEIAFARAAAEFNGLQPPLGYQPADRTTLAHLDAALDRLALTPAPFRKRILQAFAAALAADGTLSATEAELLRAIAAALDCPLPPMLE
jgi:Zn-dependent protease with chaperone function/uncharacterized tellurite resistance protein B-like protein